ncbi:hypothetical protein EPUS_09044 [Endocarpon pusillum Z07020]|uniref:Azaphilone pigments biosynthesis cluster protein L N-terminal domain-containing protein n=1 Tax=Endocarpon pusillum (strain Z07020 / HMAS-L-300199) TaxID=1263415 RepID=U1GFT4_ENDPU|nr:uncharacterized protein EPUS_09044 [Endocarpon pusillum Z07020]ERF70973.1 hypothetical protein EPUS_09044 [Endocarpon pusillum Z07020]
MAEPLSIAGSTVGIVSFGITVCKDLVTFVDHVKDGKSEKSQISSRMDQLANCLGQLQSVVDATKSPDEDIISCADPAINACATALERVREKLPSSSQQSGKGSFSSYVREWKTNLAYPFRRGELLSLKEMVEGFQQNLLVASAALQLAQQQRNHDHVSLELASISRLMIENATSIQDGHTNLRSDIESIGDSFQPVAADMCVIKEHMALLAGSITRMESRLTDTTPDTCTPSSIRKDARRLDQLHRRLASTNSSAVNRHVNKILPCQCRPTTQSRTLYSWEMWSLRPFYIAQETSFEHEKDCLYSAYSEARKNLQLRLSFCTALFRSKVQLNIQLYYGAGMFGVSLPLRIHRIVPESSPAFSLISNLHNDIKIPYVGEVYISRLREFFEKRDASPHDRLNDGQTLLNALCMEVWKVWFLSPYSAVLPGGRTLGEAPIIDLIPFLLKVMGDTALELSDRGIGLIPATPSHHALNTELFQPEYSPYRATMKQLIQYGIFEENSFCNDFVFSMLTKSLKGLRDVISRNPDLFDHTSGYSYNGLVAMTALGWRDGCQVLLETGVSYSGKDDDLEDRLGELLYNAVLSEDTNVVQFWLEKRRILEHQGLSPNSIIETVLSRSIPSINILIILVKELVEQRRRLKSLAKINLRNNKDFFREDRELDANARTIFDVLVQQCVDVTTCLRPVLQSVYHTFRPHVGVAEHLYKAGFRDVKASDFDQISGAIPPLMWNAAAIEEYSDEEFPDAFAICEWLISKGAELTETWPDSNTSAWKLLSYQAARWILRSLGLDLDEFERFNPTSKEAIILQLLSNAHVDGCICACSRHGCSALSSFIRGAIERKYGWVGNRTLIFILASWVAPVVRSHRRLATDFLRALTFWQLGIRHKCCNIAPLAEGDGPFSGLKGPYSRSKRWLPGSRSWLLGSKSWVLGSKDLYGSSVEFTHEVSLAPRYDSAQLEEIMEEDQHLVDRLEDLMTLFEAAYNRLDQDILDFVMGFWSERMLQELQEQAMIDIQKYGDGRKQLGIGQVIFDPSETGLIGKVDLDDRLEDFGRNLNPGSVTSYLVFLRRTSRIKPLSARMLGRRYPESQHQRVCNLRKKYADSSCDTKISKSVRVSCISAYLWHEAQFATKRSLAPAIWRGYLLRFSTKPLITSFVRFSAVLYAHLRPDTAFYSTVGDGGNGIAIDSDVIWVQICSFCP